jgi:ribosome-binding factor A
MKSDGRRVPRVEREVQQCIAQYLLRDYRGRLPGLVTVSRVLMPADLRTARVYVSVLSDNPEHQDEVLEFLQNAIADIQYHLGRELKMRYCPKIKFFADETTEKVLKIEAILKEIESQNRVREPEAESFADSESEEKD